MYWLRLVLFSFFICFSSYAKTYEIAEPDFLEELESRKYEIANRIVKESKKIKKRLYSLAGEPLAPAKKNHTYYVNPTIKLQADIPMVDKTGKIVGILYKKGTKINPLDYLTVKPPPFIVFNACDDREITIVKRLIKEKHLLNYILVSTNCPIKQIKERKVATYIGNNIYLLTKEMKDKLKLKYTVSFVDVDLKKKRIKVEVYKKDIN